MMYVRYTLGALFVLFTKLLTYILAPILALFTTKIGGRRYLIKPLHLFQTHDAPLDEYQVSPYYTGKWTERFRNWNWFMDVCWLWRNPAYGFAQLAGYSQRDMKLTIIQEQHYDWKSGRTNHSSLKAVNGKGQKAFMYEGNYHYFKRWNVEYYFGWKLRRSDPDQKAMLVVRFNPFKRYTEKPPRF